MGYALVMGVSRWIATVALLAVACGDGGEETRAPLGQAQVCAPGRSEPCTGPAGCQGGQVCDDDGAGYGECVCEVDSGGGGDGRVPTLEDCSRIGLGSHHWCGDQGMFLANCKGGDYPAECLFYDPEAVWCCPDLPRND